MNSEISAESERKIISQESVAKMLGFNFEPSMIEYAKKSVPNLMALDEATLRAYIADLDGKIAFYEEDIKQSDAETAELLADVEKLAAGYDSNCSVQSDN